MDSGWTGCLLFPTRGSGVRVPLAPLVRSKIRTASPRVQQQSTATGRAEDAAHAFELGLALAGGGAQIPGLGAEFWATDQEERLWEGPSAACPAASRHVLNLPFQGWFLSLIQRVSEWQPICFTYDS